MIDGEFGSGDPVEEPRTDNSGQQDDGNLADVYLGLAAAPADANQDKGEGGPTREPGEQAPAPGDAGTAQEPSQQPSGQAGEGQSQGATGPFQMPQDLMEQYQRFLASQQTQAPYSAQVPAYAPGGVMPGYPQGYSQGMAVQPYPGYTPVVPGAQGWPGATPVQPAAPQQQQQGQEPDIDDTTWSEQFYENPRKVLAQEVERRAAQLATKIIEQRESQFGQVLGPMLQQMQARLHSLQSTLVQREWSDRMIAELEALKAQDEANFERVAPYMKTVLNEDPRLKMGLATGQLGLPVVYALAAQKAAQNGAPPQGQPGAQAQVDPKKLARMPEGSGRRVMASESEPDNDALVDAFLGPSAPRGEFG